MNKKRIVVTGMSVNTLLGDTQEDFLNGLFAGRSNISRWKRIDSSRSYSKIGGDLGDYDIDAKMARLSGCIPEDAAVRMRQLVRRAPWSTKLSVLLAADGWQNAGLFGASIDPYNCAVVVAGHNINSNYTLDNALRFQEEPDYIDGLFALHYMDTDHAGQVSEMLQTKGPLYTVAGACASGNLALRRAVDEIRYHDAQAAIVVGAVSDGDPVLFHGMALMNAISYQSFNDEPWRASRPFDQAREGFVPAHGGATLVIEELNSALHRGAHIYAEVMGVAGSSDSNHTSEPSQQGQTRLINRVLAQSGLAPEQIDYISAHATSTPLGDLTEIRAIKAAFGAHAYQLKVNATKSLLGHTCAATATVETVAAILQMNAGRLHPSINIDQIDPEIDLDVCQSDPVEYPVRFFMKNSFGFGGINCVSVFGRYTN